MTYQRLFYDSPPRCGCVRVHRGMQTIELPHDSTPETWESLIATLGEDYEVTCVEGNVTLGWPDGCEPLTVSGAPDLVSLAKDAEDCALIINQEGRYSTPATDETEADPGQNEIITIAIPRSSQYGYWKIYRNGDFVPPRWSKEESLAAITAEMHKIWGDVISTNLSNETHIIFRFDSRVAVFPSTWHIALDESEPLVKTCNPRLE